MPFGSISIRTDRYGRLRHRSRSRSPSRRNNDDRRDRRRSRSRERRRRSSRSRSSERVSSSKQTTFTDGSKSFAVGQPSRPAPPPMPAPDRETSLLRQVATLSGLVDPAAFDKDQEQKLLEDEMLQRRQRIEKWRADKNTDVKVTASTTTPGTSTQLKDSPQNVVAPPLRKSKRWTHGEDDDEDEDDSLWPTLKKNSTVFGKKKSVKLSVANVKEENDAIADNTAMQQTTPAVTDEDPLDAFMHGVQHEVKQLQQRQVLKNKGNISILVPKVEPSSSSVVAAKSSAVGNGISRGKKGELVSLDPEDSLSQWVSSAKDEDESTSAVPGSSTARDLADIERLAGGLQQSQSKQQKLSKAFNHQHGEYAPFSKEFYREVPELAQMTDEQVAEVRDRDGIQVRGKNCPRPLVTWSQAGISSKTVATLKKAGYEKPTPIQAQAIPCIMSGRDVIAIAKTGSGKTLAFVLPFLRHCAAQPDLEADDGPIGLVMAPTRELAVQIAKECKRFCKPLNLEVACVYGGLGTSEQIAMLKRGVHLIVCTPGRMIEILMANNGRVTNLRRVTYLVLDEADRMFDMGFEPQVMLIIDNTRPDRQTVLFSATFPRPMEALAKRILNQRPIQIQVGGRSIVASDVEQHAVLIEEDKKFLKLLEIIGRYTSPETGGDVVLVFVDRQEKADLLLKDLMRASYSVMALHGGVDQFDRDSIINDFKNGNIQVLVATSVAARGLDVKNLILVVNYDCPNHYEDYVHRCGRTGRAGNKGYAYTFITPQQEKFTPDLVQGIEMAGQEVPYDLKVMHETYKAVLNAEGKQIKGGSGFGGRGFKFDDMEQAVAKEARKFQQAITTGAGEDDDFATADGSRLDVKIEGLFKSTKRVREGRPLGPFGSGSAPDAASASGTGPPAVPAAKTSVDIGQKLLMAQKRATQIRQEKFAAGAEKLSVEAMLRAADSTVKFIEGTTKSARGVAEQVAEKIHAKLNYVKDEIPKTAEGAMLEENEPAQTYEEELDINDFPQQVRFRLTSKDILAQVCEYAEAYVSVRGQHVPAGKQPKIEGDRKLHLLIESFTEIGVSKAKGEVIRIVKEELLRMQHAPVAKTTRYKVV